MPQKTQWVVWVGLCGLMLSFSAPSWGKPLPPGVPVPSGKTEPAPLAPLAPLALNTLARGATLTSQGQAYQILPELRAVAPSTGGLAAALAPFGRAPADVVARPAHFHVFRQIITGPLTQGAPVHQIGEQTSFPVVVNARTGALGVLPGTILVRMTHPSDASAVAQAHGLTVHSRFEHLGLAVLAVAPGADLTTAQAQVAADPRVTRADIEVIEHTLRPQ